MRDRLEGDSRRRFIRRLALASAAPILGVVPVPAAADPPPETTALRLGWSGGVCQAPQYVAEGLLRAEGFSDVQYPTPSGCTRPA